MTPDSAKPYIIRALYEWCMDEALTPHLYVQVDKNCQVPKSFVKDGGITLNIGPLATKDLHIDNQWVSFSARFGGQAQELMFPVATVAAFFARETQEGMSFGVNPNYELTDEDDSGEKSTKTTENKKKGKVLKIIK